MISFRKVTIHLYFKRMKNMKIISLAAVIILLLYVISCKTHVKELKEGQWHGTFLLSNEEIPFVFEIKGSIPESQSAFLINGSEHFPIKSISYREDSVSMSIDLFDAVLTGKIEGNTLTGKFKKLTTEKPDPGISFRAEWGNIPRFASENIPAKLELAGTWDIFFRNGDSTEATVGNFQNEKNGSTTGSILTNTGDYRYLEGIVSGNSFKLSAFSGNSPYLVKGTFTSDSTFSGEFVTSRKATKIEGKRNSKATLADPYSFSGLKEGFKTITFTFPDLTGKPVSLADSKFKGKVVIISILGSWCPNCIDETSYLAPWYKENRNRGVEIIGLAFERKNDFEFAKHTLARLRERFDIQYDLLFAGQSSTAAASQALPALTGITAFPSTIFVDKKGNVRKVHTGFSGPATGKFYEEWKNEFNQLIDNLVAEN